MIGVDLGECQTEASWTELLRGVVRRGPVGVQLAVSDAHQGLKAAIPKVPAGRHLEMPVITWASGALVTRRLVIRAVRCPTAARPGLSHRGKEVTVQRPRTCRGLASAV